MDRIPGSAIKSDLINSINCTYYEIDERADYFKFEFFSFFFWCTFLVLRQTQNSFQNSVFSTQLIALVIGECANTSQEAAVSITHSMATEWCIILRFKTTFSHTILIYILMITHNKKYCFTSH